MNGNQKNIRTTKIALNANVPHVIETAGNMFNVLKATADISMTFDESNRLNSLSKGANAEFVEQYSRVEIVSESTQTIEVVLGFGRFQTSGNATVDTVNVGIATADTFFIRRTIVSNSTTQIVFPNATNKECILNVPSDADVGIYISDSTNNISSEGFLLESGMSINIATTQAIFARRAGNTDVEIGRIITRLS